MRSAEPGTAADRLLGRPLQKHGRNRAGGSGIADAHLTKNKQPNTVGCGIQGKLCAAQNRTLAFFPGHRGTMRHIGRARPVFRFTTRGSS